MAEWLTPAVIRRAMLAPIGVYDVECLDAAFAVRRNSKKDIVRVLLAVGQCAWCTEYAKGWSLVAVAPAGEWFDVDCVDRKAFFVEGRPFPPHWQTPRRLRKNDQRVARIMTDKPPEVDAPAVGLMAWGKLRGERKYRLGEIAKLRDDGSIDHVYLRADNDDTTPVDGWEVLRWKQAGARREWQSKQIFANYKILVMRIGARQAELDRKDGKRAARAKSPQATSAQHAYEEGFAAYGRRHERIPPFSGRKAISWLNGWDAAQAEEIADCI